MEVTATLLLVTGIVGVIIGVTAGTLATSVALRRSHAREVAWLEHEIEQYESLSGAIHRLTHVVAAGPQAWYWTDEWQEGEREADKDLAEGRSERFTSVEDMDAALAKASLRYAANR